MVAYLSQWLLAWELTQLSSDTAQMDKHCARVPDLRALVPTASHRRRRHISVIHPPKQKEGCSWRPLGSKAALLGDAPSYVQEMQPKCDKKKKTTEATQFLSLQPFPAILSLTPGSDRGSAWCINCPHGSPPVSFLSVTLEI